MLASGVNLNKMVAYSMYVKAFIPFVLTLNFITFLFVWQIYDNVMVIEEKVQKLLIEKEISRVSIETDISKKQTDLLKDIGRNPPQGRLKLDSGGEPMRVPVAKLQELNSWMNPDNSNRQRRGLAGDEENGVNVGETRDNAFKVVKVAGSKNFRVVKVEEERKEQAPGGNYGNAAPAAMMNKSGDADTYLPQLDGENIISMSLWGRDRRYTVGAMRNAELVRRYFPGWKIRIYTETTHDGQMFQSIPNDVMATLRGLGVQFEFMDPSESKVPPMMWRFLVADDMSVDRFIVRDTDSRLSARDAAAVWAWEQSGKAFHCIRDHPSHSLYAVSGGMWGGKPAALRNILRKSWRQIMHGARTDYLTDMNFLQEAIWPKVRAFAYCSDSVSCEKWPSSHPYPIKRLSYEHVGQVYASNELSRPEDIAILRRTPENTRCVPP